MISEICLKYGSGKHSGRPKVKEDKPRYYRVFAHLHSRANGPLTINFLHLTVLDVARKRCLRSRSLWQGQRSNQGHTMRLQANDPTKYQLSASHSF